MMPGRRLTPVSHPSESQRHALHASTDLSIDRTRRSYERILLSWVRTATALITFGFSVRQFLRLARVGVTASPGLFSPHTFGLSMISIDLVALILATPQHRLDMAALQARYPGKEPYRSNATVLTALVGLLGVLGFLSMLFHD